MKTYLHYDQVYNFRFGVLFSVTQTVLPPVLISLTEVKMISFLHAQELELEF